MTKYKISKKAIKDLDNIWLYTYKNWSIEQANRYYTLLITEIEFISENFMCGKSINHIKEGYRTAQVKSHTIYYRQGATAIEIIRILHQKMSIKSRI